MKEDRYPFISALAYKDQKLHGALKELIADLDYITSMIMTRKTLLDDGVQPALCEVKKASRELIYRVVCSVSVRTMCSMTEAEGQRQSAEKAEKGVDNERV